jgi:hypothetical protein
MAGAMGRGHPRLCAGGLHRQSIDRERVLAVHGVGLRRQERFRQQYQQVIGSVAQRDLRHGHPVPQRQGLLQVVTIAVRIQPYVRQCTLHRLQGQWAGAQWIFVRRQFDDVGFPKAQLARQFADGLADGVRGQGAHRRGAELCGAHEIARG